MERIQMYVNGTWVEAKNDDVIEVKNPANGELIATIPRGTEADVNEAVRAARSAFNQKEWVMIKPHERGELLMKVAAKMKNERDKLAKLETLDVGKPLTQGYADVDAAIRYFEFYGGAADKVMGETIPIEDGMIDYTVREPVGVTAHIIPWNYPIQIISRSVAAAIATGNTVVVKSAEDTPMTANKMTKYFHELGLPNGVFNHVTGYGHEAGAALCSHRHIHHITFTGSVPTGKTVMKLAAENVVPVTLELGGKSPNIVFSDCDVEKTVETVVRSIIQNAGQTCSAGSRLIIEESFKDQFLEKVVSKFESLKIGPGIEDSDVGPILNKKQFDRILGMIDRAKSDGRLITGGERVLIKGCENGFYIKPTIFDEVPYECEIAQEEVFGPVLTVLTFKDEDEALKLANGTDYGLVTGIWTSNINRAHKLAHNVESGQVFINNYGAGGGVQMPFGGYKRSGFGREKGFIALYNYTQLKNIAIKFQ